MRHHPAVLATRAAVRAALADLPAGSLVLVAVSGGADSLALAAATAAAARRLGLVAGAVTVDHQLQPGSAARAQAVATGCQSLGLDPVDVRTVAAAGGTAGAGGPEAAARAARYAALAAAAGQYAAAAVLVGHTLDDQAETVLLRLARGSGARSLAAMPPRNGRIRRPFLEVRRADTRAACSALGLQPWDDPHNADARFTRSRVRSDLLPALAEALGPGAVPALARSADLLRADADALDDLAAKAAVDLIGTDGVDIDGVLALPVALRRRVLRAAAISAGAPAGALAARHIHAIDTLLTDWHGQGPVSLPGGLVAQRRCGRLLFR